MWAHSHECLTDSFWGDNKPSTRTGNSNDCCVMVLKRNHALWWEDHSCLVPDISKRPVAPICQHDGLAASTTTTPPPTTTTPVACLPDWFEFEGHCYSPKPFYLSWNLAEEDCMRYGGHLASIHSKAEDDFTAKLLTNSYWIGGSGSGYLNDWTWSDGTSWDFSHWYSEIIGYQCVFYNHGDGWENYACSGRYNYIYKI